MLQPGQVVLPFWWPTRNPELHQEKHDVLMDVVFAHRQGQMIFKDPFKPKPFFESINIFQMSSKLELFPPKQFFHSKRSWCILARSSGRLKDIQVIAVLQQEVTGVYIKYLLFYGVLLSLEIRDSLEKLHYQH